MEKTKDIIIISLAVFLILSAGINIFYMGHIGKSITGISGNLVSEKNSGSGKVTIDEFSDFQCPYCAMAEPLVQSLKEEYGDKIEIVYHHFPLDFHKYAEKSAEASECARDQNKFDEYKNILFQNQKSLDVESLKSYASALKLDAEIFNKCMDSGEKYQVVQNNLMDGISKGVGGTPTFFINGKIFEGPRQYSEFKKVIDGELSR